LAPVRPASRDAGEDDGLALRERDKFIRRSTRRATYFSVSLRPDGCGRLIGQPLHLTVEPLAWWTTRLGAWWRDLSVLRHDPGEAVELVADGWAGPRPTGRRQA
jgi:hypothetical protein